MRGFTPTEETDARRYLQAALNGEITGRATRWWRDQAIDLTVGLEGPDYGDGPGGKGQPVRVRLTPVRAQEAPDQALPYLYWPRVLTPVHAEQMAAMAVQMWLGRHTVRNAMANALEANPQIAASAPGEAVPTWMGILSASPLTMEDTDATTYQQATGALLSDYLLGHKPPDPGEMARPNLDAMGTHAAAAVSHRWDSQAGRWEPFRLTANMESEADGWAGSLTAIGLVSLHEVASRHILTAASFLSPWTRLAPVTGGLGREAPFLRDSPRYDALGPAERMWARVGWATMWAMEEHKRTMRLLPGGGG